MTALLHARLVLKMAATRASRNVLGAARHRGIATTTQASDFPSSNRWSRQLVMDSSSDDATTQVLVLQKDGYDDWLAAQPEELRAWMLLPGGSSGVQTQ